jgi:hypothetical protein
MGFHININPSQIIPSYSAIAIGISQVLVVGVPVAIPVEVSPSKVVAC